MIHLNAAGHGLSEVKPGPRCAHSLRTPGIHGANLNTAVLTTLRHANLAQLSPRDSNILLGNARLLQSAIERRQTSTLLRGKKLALLCESEDGADAVLFRSAASALGAHVSHVRPRLGDLKKPDDLELTAQMLGRLYDGIECQGLAAALVEVVGREAGVPVYDGVASEHHPTALLAGQLQGESPGRLRQLMLQTVLLSTLA